MELLPTHYSLVRITTSLVFYLAAAICASDILLTLTPSTLGPNEKMSLNCSFTSNFTDGAVMYFSDQDGKAIAVFVNGESAEAKGDYISLVSNLQHPDRTRLWASADLTIPYCSTLKTIKCHLMTAETQLQDDKTFQVFKMSEPDLFYNDTCLTCDHSDQPIPPLYLSDNSSSTLECRLNRVTQMVELTWSEGFRLIKGTNVTVRDRTSCTYSHKSRAHSPDLHSGVGRHDVTCTAVSPSGRYKSATVQVISGTDDPTIAPDTLKEDRGTPGWLVPVIVIPCVVLVLSLLIVGFLIYKKRHRKKAPKIQYREVILKTDRL